MASNLIDQASGERRLSSNLIDQASGERLGGICRATSVELLEHPLNALATGSGDSLRDTHADRLLPGYFLSHHVCVRAVSYTHLTLPTICSV